MSPRTPLFTPEMARGMSEATLQGNVLHTATVLGWLCYHTHDSRRSQPGFPDLVMLNAAQRRLIFAELKTERGRQTPQQRAWERAIRASSQGEFYLWRPTDWLDETIVYRLRNAPDRHRPYPGASFDFWAITTNRAAAASANPTIDRKGQR